MNSHQELIKSAVDSVMTAHELVKNDPSRPQFHLLPPSMWMNDPNGPIYYNNKYHLFYQHNPYNSKWGVMYWGHAVSSDLVNWTHLPIALAPDREHGEKYCFSGCCVNNNGIPTILYTSIKSLGFGVIFGAQTWSATSDSDLIHWRKNPSNPVLDRSIHKNQGVRQLRDPFVWKENNLWHLVLGGQLTRPWRGAIFHYTSVDLETWDNVGVLCEGNPKTHRKPWECPNVLKWGNKSVILISPFNKIQYAMSSESNKELEWIIFDHGKSFYAPNSMQNPENRDEYLLWGWIKGGGLAKQWNGCFSIPRILRLSDKELIIKPSPKLQQLRLNHQHFENQPAIVNLHNGCGELVLKVSGNYRSSIEIYTNPEKKYEIEFNPSEKSIIMGNERVQLQFQHKETNIHLFIDRSVLELFINYQECFSSRFYPDSYLDMTVDCKASGTDLISLDTWDMNPITQEFELK